MSPEKSPDVKLFPRIEKLGKFLGSLLVPFHEPVEPYMSEHYRPAETELGDAA